MIDFGIIFENTLSGILTNLPWFILAIWVTKTIVREMPGWLATHHKNQIKEIVLNRAVNQTI